MSAVPADRLALLYRISQTFNSSLDLDEVLDLVIDEVIATTRAERGFLMLCNERGQVSFRTARGLDQTTIDEPTFQVSRSVVERVAQTGQPVLTSDAQQDVRLNLRRSVLALGLRSILCVPLLLKNTVTGVVYVDNRMQAGIFSPADLDLLTAIASTAAIAIENARLYGVAVEKGRLERELQVARELQSSLLPRHAPQAAGWDFAARWQPAREVAGDYYDFIPGERPDRLGLVIADVTDKGMAAALFMALTRSTVRACLARSATPAAGIAVANQLIASDAPNGMFVTLCYAHLSLDSGQAVFVNAGHNPPLLYAAASDSWQTLSRTGMALGVDPGAVYAQRALTLGPGDFVLLYTDGVTDALNAQGEEFGAQRLQDVAAAHRAAPAAGLLAGLEQALADFTGAAAPFDDLTLLVARRL
ncbi:MAG: SpoIIE family protein phosphatase [Anaerolineales bacterium]|nr:SpoIIE family protein phosphatase [Anaerolineales bacterium]